MTATVVSALAAVATCVVSLCLTGRVRAYAVSANVLDIANDRSMHRHPTPRGGGLAIVIAFGAGLIILAGCGVIAPRMACAFVCGGVPIAVVGWFDDRKHVNSIVRLGVHVSGCVLALFVYGVEKICPSGVPIAIGLPVIAICMAWCVNLYNFMDGLDGFSASEGVFTGFAAAALLAGLPFQAPSILVGAACLGFLFWNWPPAKIFMGDSGSGFLGFCFALLAATSLSMSNFFVWPILLSVFVSDATVTLLTRMATGERWSQAHNTHAFQVLAKRTGHSRVTKGLWGVNLLVVLPTAWLASTTSLGPWLCLGLFAVQVIAVILVRRREGATALRSQHTTTSQRQASSES